ncbi:unnamed protein product [Toxocara canis]|uniref:Cobalamin biosynthesis protein CbiX n=1 Tax=Toxocara canis TaxID=6265 RepID=A0A183U5T8_TOXCA|nr:unnamed protein product [Toxocara canis]
MVAVVHGNCTRWPLEHHLRAADRLIGESAPAVVFISAVKGFALTAVAPNRQVQSAVCHEPLASQLPLRAHSLSSLIEKRNLVKRCSQP